MTMAQALLYAGLTIDGPAICGFKVPRSEFTFELSIPNFELNFLAATGGTVSGGSEATGWESRTADGGVAGSGNPECSNELEIR